jgi:hypothetical protein
MRRVAAASDAVSQPRRVVADATASAAAVLKATSCSVTSTGVVRALWAEWVAGRADLTSDVAGNPGTTCDMSGSLRMVGGSDGESQLRYEQREAPRDTQYLIQIDEIQLFFAPYAKRKFPMRLLVHESRAARWSPSSNSRGL